MGLHKGESIHGGGKMPLYPLFFSFSVEIE